MNNQMTLQELMDYIKAFCEERDWDQYHNPKDLAIGISTEANELLDIFRFKNESDIISLFENPEKRSQINDEIADVLFFVLRFAQKNNINLDEALLEKVKKNSEKYPSELVKGKNLKYNEY